jgi:hypothetical protein
MNNIITVFTAITLMFSSILYGEENPLDATAPTTEPFVTVNETPKTNKCSPQIKQVGQAAKNGSNVATPSKAPYIIAAVVVVAAIVAIAVAHNNQHSEKK